MNVAVGNTMWNYKEPCRKIGVEFRKNSGIIEMQIGTLNYFLTLIHGSMED